MTLQARRSEPHVRCAFPGAIPGGFLAGAFAMLALAPGCEDVRHEYVPLAPGNSWTYRIISSGREVGRDTIEVTKRLPAPAGGEGAGWSPGRFRVREPSAEAVWYSDGGTIMRRAGRLLTTVFQHPPFIGTGWMDTGPAGEIVYCSVEARETVSTPAGVFTECIRVRRETEDRSAIVTQWFAPEVGLVRWRVERPRAAAVEWVLSDAKVGWLKLPYEPPGASQD